MKIRLHLHKFFLVIVSFVPVLTMAQDDNPKTFYIEKATQSTVDQVQLDFAVPDNPAFKSLGKDPSNILRPSSVKDLALQFGNFTGSGSFIIPKDFSLEVAPGLLVNPWYTLNDYQNKRGIRFLSKLRISIGAASDDATNTNSLAAGIHITLLDKSDFRKDTAFLKTYIFDKQDRFTISWKKYRDAIIVQKGLTIEQYDALPQPDKDAILDQAKANVGYELDTIISNALTVYKKQNWNASRIDFAYSLLSQSRDSLLSNTKIQKHSFWLSAAIRPGRNNNWGQLLIGINNNVVRADDKFYNEFNGNLRFYAGANRVKGFIEAQYQNLDNPIARQETLYAQIGLEVAVLKSIWLHFGTGVLNALDGSKKSEILSNLNLYFSFPENFRLF
jgi:hypothetical protein